MEPDKISLTSASEQSDESLHIIPGIKPSHSLAHSLYYTSAIAAQYSWVLGDIDSSFLDLCVARIECSRFDSDEDFAWSRLVDFANAESKRCLSGGKNEGKMLCRHCKDGGGSLSERQRDVVQ